MAHLYKKDQGEYWELSLEIKDKDIIAVLSSDVADRTVTVMYRDGDGQTKKIKCDKISFV
jgi:hypothetical protein